MKRQLDSATLIRPAVFAHFVLRVRDIEASIRWYETVVGMRVVHRAGMLAFLTYDDEHHRLALAQTPVEAEAVPGAPGLDHVAYTFESLGDLLASYVRLEALGIHPVWKINHGPTTSLYYEDPDGNRVELQIDNFPSVAELNAWMQSDAFKANPIGTPFDPARLVERYEAGDPIEELVQQGAA
jgi:catechol-2,3-dioxygenase